MSKVRPAALLALVILAGCYFGSRAEKYRPATSASGATIRAWFAQNQFGDFELVEVQDTLLLVHGTRGAYAGRYQLVDPRRLVAVTVHGLKYDAIDLRRLDEAQLRNWRQAIRLVARYPQGLTAEQRTILFQASGQTTPERLP